MSLSIEFTFPTVFAFEDNLFSDEENKTITEKCYEISKNVSLEHEGWLSKERSPKNTLKSNNLYNEPDMSFFFDKLNDRIHEFARFNNDNAEYACSHSWFNIYDEANYQEPHAHKIMTYSAVYFPKVPTGSGKLVFLNPVINEMGSTVSHFPTANEWIYEPREKMLVIFRSNVRHYVLHGSNKEDRISIASNYALSPEYYSKTFF